MPLNAPRMLTQCSPPNAPGMLTQCSQCSPNAPNLKFSSLFDLCGGRAQNRAELGGIGPNWVGVPKKSG